MDINNKPLMIGRMYKIKPKIMGFQTNNQYKIRLSQFSGLYTIEEIINHENIYVVCTKISDRTRQILNSENYEFTLEEIGGRKKSRKKRGTKRKII